MFRHPPSYHTGFAPRDGISLYPHLWNGCVGAWCPSLGPTGATLRDWSGRGRHGTLTSFDLSDAWVASSGKYALNFDNVDSVVDTGSTPLPTSRTLTAWIKWNDSGSGLDAIVDAYVSGGTIWYLDSPNNRLYYYEETTTSSVQEWYCTFVSTVWTHIAITHDFATTTAPTIYINSVPQSLTQSLTAVGWSGLFGAANLGIGRRVVTNAHPFDGLMDDIRVYDRMLLTSDIRLLSRRRGIAYERQPRRWSKKPRGTAAGGSVFSSPVFSAGV